MDAAEMLAKQIIGLSWIRCCMEEGVDFRNKQTGEVESNERVIFDNFEHQTGVFDLPSCKVSPYGMEKNLLEVIGSYTIYNKSPGIRDILFSEAFSEKIDSKIQEIRRKDND